MTKYLCKYINVIETDLDESVEQILEMATQENDCNLKRWWGENFVGFTAIKVSNKTLKIDELNAKLLEDGCNTVCFVESEDINKEVFIYLLKTLPQDRFYDSEDQFDSRYKLIYKLEHSDFFYAPATIKGHCNFEGGLLLHSLNVYFNLLSILATKENFRTEEWDAFKVCGLLHDISRMNYYEKSVKNVKVYSKAGSKQDELGKFDWEAQPSYKTRDVNDRFIYGGLEQNSLFMIRTFMKLSIYEEVAILHSLGQENQERDGSDNTQVIFAKYPLASMLHIADMLACYLDEFDFEVSDSNE